MKGGAGEAKAKAISSLADFISRWGVGCVRKAGELARKKCVSNHGIVETSFCLALFGWVFFFFNPPPLLAGGLETFGVLPALVASHFLPGMEF